MGSIEQQLGASIDSCDVCKVPLEDLQSSLTAEYQGKLLSFCSQICYKRYLEDPAHYAEFEDDTVLE